MASAGRPTPAMLQSLAAKTAGCAPLPLARQSGTRPAPVETSPSRPRNRFPRLCNRIPHGTPRPRVPNQASVTARHADTIANKTGPHLDRPASRELHGQAPVSTARSRHHTTPQPRADDHHRGQGWSPCPALHDAQPLTHARARAIPARRPTAPPSPAPGRPAGETRWAPGGRERGGGKRRRRGGRGGRGDGRAGGETRPGAAGAWGERRAEWVWVWVETARDDSLRLLFASVGRALVRIIVSLPWTLFPLC